MANQNKRRVPISLIQKEISDFAVQVHCNGSFQAVTKIVRTEAGLAYLFTACRGK